MKGDIMKYRVHALLLQGVHRLVACRLIMEEHIEEMGIMLCIIRDHGETDNACILKLFQPPVIGIPD